MRTFYALIDTNFEGSRITLGYYKRHLNALDGLHETVSLEYPSARFRHEKLADLDGFAIFKKSKRLGVYVGSLVVEECEFEDGYGPKGWINDENGGVMCEDCARMRGLKKGKGA